VESSHQDDQTARRWTDFAAIMIMLGGILNVIWGIIALTHSSYFQANGYVVTNLHTWGWIVLFVGILELVAAWSIWNGGEFGRYFGIVVAMLNAVSALVSINAYPVWGVCLFAIDVLIIYALVTYGGRGSSTQAPSHGSHLERP
jgi:hypothetical protein